MEIDVLDYEPDYSERKRLDLEQMDAWGCIQMSLRMRLWLLSIIKKLQLVGVVATELAWRKCRHVHRKEID